MKIWLFVTVMAACAALAIALVGLRLSRYRFTCKACGRTFRISWRRALWVQHFNDDYILRCPRCGKRGWCAAAASDKKEDD